MLVQSKGAFVSKRFARPRMQPWWKQDGLAHVVGISKLSLGNSDNGTVPVLNHLLLDGNGIANLLKEWVLNVVDSRFGKEVVIVIVNKAADMTRWDDDFSVENVLQKFTRYHVSYYSEVRNIVVVITSTRVLT